jgi:hypothetical protein
MSRTGFVTTSVPTINGTLEVGSTLTSDVGTWVPAVTPSYQWRCSNTNTILGSESSYTLKSQDAGCLIELDVTSTNPGYTPVTRIRISPIAVVNVFTSTPTPVIAGAPALGSFVTASNSNWGPGVLVQYQWYLNGVAIPGETGPTHQVSASEVGHQLQVQVTASKVNFVTETVSSASLFISPRVAAIVPSMGTSATIKKGKSLKVALSPGGKNSQGLVTTVQASGSCSVSAIKKSVKGLKGKQLVGYTIKMTRKGTCVTTVSVAGSSNFDPAVSTNSITVN